MMDVGLADGGVLPVHPTLDDAELSGTLGEVLVEPADRPRVNPSNVAAQAGRRARPLVEDLREGAVVEVALQSP